MLSTTAITLANAADLDVIHEDLQRLQRQAVQFADESLAASTRRAYADDVRDFSAWCAAHALVALPADAATVALYLTAIAHDRHNSVSTIRRRLAAISKWHQLASHPDPTDSEHVRTVAKGIRRSVGVAPVRKRALLRDEVIEVGRRLPTDLCGLRDRALLLWGFQSAMRRSELAEMQLSWLEFGTQGVLVTFPRSKTNQEGDVEQIVVAPREADCAIEAIERWLDAAGIVEGPVFVQFDNRRRMRSRPMTGWGIARVVKGAVGAVGFVPGDYSGHSLRRGFVTSARRAGIGIETIMQTTRHRTVGTALAYIEQEEKRRLIGEPRARRTVFAP